MIIVLEERGLYKAIQRNFSPDAFELVKAVSVEQVRLLASIRTLRLVVATAGEETAELARALKDISAGRVSTLGLITGEDVSLEETRSFTAAIPADDLSAILNLCCDLLDERRAEPRVALRFPVVLNEMGEGIVQNVSASGLLIRTMMPLTKGQAVKVQVGWGATPLNFKAKVGRSAPASLGQKALALLVSQDETEARHFLKGLSDRVLDLHHYLAAWHPDPADDDARLEDLVDLYGLDMPGPGALKVDLNQPTKGPLLPDKVRLADGGSEDDDEEKPSGKEQKEPEEKDEQDEEKQPKRPKRDPGPELKPEPDPPKKAANKGAAAEEEEKQPREKSNMATWALAAVVAAALVMVVAWPRIQRWQEQTLAPPSVVTPPDLGPPPEPDASDEVVEISSSERANLMKQGRSLMARKKYKRALQSLEQALFLEDGEDVRRLLAKIHRRTGNVKLAIEHYEFLAKQAPEVAWFPDMIGRLHLQSNDRDKACEAFREAFKIDPAYKEAGKNLKRHCKEDEAP